MRPIVHLELHTCDADGAQGFYTDLFSWHPELVKTRSGSYLGVELGPLRGGFVECATPHAIWLPYVEVPEIRGATEHAQALGARVLLAPREGPAGWRSVVATRAAGEVALWQPKR